MFAAPACSTASFHGLKPAFAARKHMAQAKRRGAHVWTRLVWRQMPGNTVPRSTNADAAAYCTDDIRRS